MSTHAATHAPSELVARPQHPLPAMPAPMVARLQHLLRAPAMRSTLAFGFGGAAFSVANLLLARDLATADFGRFALVVAIVNLSSLTSALGLDGSVLRRLLPPSAALLRRAMLNGGLTGLVLAAGAALLYELGAVTVAALALAVSAGAPTRVAAAVHQSRHDFGRALPIAQSDNVLALLAAGAVLLAPRSAPWLGALAIAIVTLGRVIAALVAWRGLLPRGAAGQVTLPGWREQASFVSIAGVGAVMVQLDRLAIGRLLPLEELATFGVLAAVIGAPFRVLQNAAGYTLTPRLRTTDDPAARRRLVLREALLVGAVLLLASAAVCLALPPILRHVLEGRYVIGPALVIAALFSGAAKVADTFGVAIVSALGGERDIARLGASGWGTLLLAVAGSVAGAAFGGLTGLVLGVSAGWWARAVHAAALARAQLAPAAAPTRAP